MLISKIHRSVCFFVDRTSIYEYDHIMGIFQISRGYILYAYLFMEDLKNTLYGGRPEYSSKTFCPCQIHIKLWDIIMDR